jgi:hypothetical protein
MWSAFPTSDYYGGSAPSSNRQPTVGLPATGLVDRRVGRSKDGSHVHHVPFDGVGAQLFPCNLATVTPQAFTVASKPANPRPTQELPRTVFRARIAARPISARFEPVFHLRGFHHWFLQIRTPIHHACRTRAVWQCRPVPSLSGLLLPPLAPPRLGCPQLRQTAATA